MSSAETENKSYEDESLYSRQQLMLGKEAMRKMAQASVFLSGLGGLGAEIAKNVALAGVKSLTLHDTKAATAFDLSTNFYLTADHVASGANRAEATQPRISELNPYTRLSVSTTPLGNDEASISKAIDGFTCVVLTDAPLEQQIVVDAVCRAKNIKFIAADVHGVFAFAFCDFGENYEVFDLTGEEPKSALIGNLTVADGRVTVETLEGLRHDMETGNGVRFSEIQGELGSVLNDAQFEIKCEKPTTFSFAAPEGLSGVFLPGKGMVDEVKLVQTGHHQSLETQLKAPALTIADLGKFEDPPHVFAGMVAMHKFCDAHNGQKPQPWHAGDAEEVVAGAKQHLAAMGIEGDLLADPVRLLSFTSRGSYVGQTAFLGGVVSQEVLKALSGKYGPLSQWLVFDTREICPSLDLANDADTVQKEFHPRGDRLDGQRVCFGTSLCDKIANLKLFMIGCGAIGCEMLKNFAMLGVGSGSEGLITVTDNDHIEKSNLNRQFLFRNDDIGHPKSERASAAAQRMNSGLKITHYLDKIAKDTEEKYSDEFFGRQDLICNALDNVAARIYVDGRCVQNRKPLLESGTLGPKGHVQVVLPHKTESYASQRDPPEKDVPFCTLKSFPSQIEHCIEWARDFSFGGLFVNKPQQFNQLLEEPWDDLLRRLREPYGGGLDLRVVRTFDRLLTIRPASFDDCLQFARKRFESYYVNKTKTLLNLFPLDHVADAEKGTLFWVSPKRPPREQPFDFNDETHRSFVLSLAALWAAVFGIEVPKGLRQPDEALLASCRKTIDATELPTWTPKKKVVVTDEKASKDDAQKQEASSGPSDDELDSICKRLADKIEKIGRVALPKLEPADFEKDDDSNHHIDFLSACANLRAEMYAIKTVDRLKVKGIAGRIMPAIATTTAAVSGCVSSELVKLAKGCTMEQHRNLFMNLALPFWGFAEPVPPEKKMLTDTVGYTIWDSWEVKHPKGKDMLLSEFVDIIKQQHNLEVGGVFKGAMMVFVPSFPGHKRRLTKSMGELLRTKGEAEYQDLTVTVVHDGKDISAPPIRFWL